MDELITLRIETVYYCSSHELNSINLVICLNGGVVIFSFRLWLRYRTTNTASFYVEIFFSLDECINKKFNLLKLVTQLFSTWPMYRNNIQICIYNVFLVE